jgi:hypothetical protein
MGRKNLLIAGFIVFALIAIPVTIFLLRQQQETRSRADCPAVPSVANVFVEFPACRGATCTFVEASCSWDSLAEAVSYNVTITEIETGKVIVDNVSTPAGTVKVFFPITQQRTYKCDVTATNNCGNVSTASSHQLFCEADAGVVPTVTPIPTSVPTNTPVPTLAPTGTPIPTATPISVPTPTTAVTAIPATPVQPTPTIRPTAVPTRAPTPTFAPTATPFPTIAKTGVVEDAFIMFGVTVIVIIVGVLIFAL